MHASFTWGAQERPLLLYSTDNLKCSWLVRVYITVQAATIALCDNEGWVKKTPSALLEEGMEQQQLRTGQLESACL